MTNNPLIQAYRKPALYITLPSGGKFYTSKPKMSIDGELAVYPMTARDELITKTPDALFNGEATNALIRSCCPDIEDPDQVPVNDLLTILIAIRQASYGDSIEVDVQCPECDYLNQMAFDANRIMSGAKSSEDVDNVVTLSNEFRVALKPYSLRDRTLLQIQQVKQTKMVQAMADQSLTDEQQTEMFGRTFVEIADLTVQLITNCITEVVMPGADESITDNEVIKEWLQQVTRADYDLIRNKVEELSDSGINQQFKVTCQDCNHTWDSTVDLDIANFFAG